MVAAVLLLYGREEIKVAARESTIRAHSSTESASREERAAAGQGQRHTQRASMCIYSSSQCLSHTAQQPPPRVSRVVVSYYASMRCLCSEK
jgi:hypothetical protein